LGLGAAVFVSIDPVVDRSVEGARSQLLDMCARWDANTLLEPIADDQPCGESLEDTPVLAAFDAFRVFGRKTPLEPAPDWSHIRALALEALRSSKDLRLLAHLATALLRTEGLPAFASTLEVAAQWLSAQWLQSYPRVDEDAVLRRNALSCFADPMAVIDGLRRMPLVSSRQHGHVGLRELDLAAGQLTPANGEIRPDEAQILAAFASAPLEDLQTLQQSAARALAAVRRIDATMRSEAGEESAPGFEGLAAVLTRMDRVLQQHLAMRPDGNGAGALGESEGSTDSGTGLGSSLGAVRSRQDAIRALDAVAEFFRQTEPSSPVPLFIERAKRLVSKNFLEVLADVAPEGVAQARAAGGLRDSE
jgi:type VI secretion system protein ImpA